MDLIQAVPAIVLVLALLGGFLFLLRRRGAAPFGLPAPTGVRTRRLEVIERASLGPHHSLHLVRIGDRCVLVATAPSFCQILENCSPETRS